MTIEDLYALAEHLGVTITHICPTGLEGGWDLELRVIYLRHDRPEYVQRWTLAHELVHALHGDDGCQPAHIEAARDSEAARMLITDTAYAAAEHEVGPDPRAIAKALDLPVEAVHAWRRGREPLRAA